MMLFALAAATSPTGSYLNWGVIHIARTNALIIAVMILVFVAAILIPFPQPAADEVTSDGVER